MTPPTTSPTTSPSSDTDGVVHHEPDGIDVVESDRDRLRAQARSVLGIEGAEASEAPPLLDTLRTTDTSLYPLLALGALIVVDQFQANALFILGPEVARALGISAGTLASLNALKALAAGLATLPMAAFVQNKPRRAVVAIVTAFLWSAVTIATGFVTATFLLALVLIIDGASTGSVQAVHQPLLMDSYPPQARVRAFSYYRAADSLGNVLAPLSVAVLTAVLAFTWRGVFLVLGIVSLLAALYAMRLRDPGFGQWDTARVRQLVHGDDASGPADHDESIALGFFEIVRRLFLIPTMRRILTAFGVFGMMLFPLQTFLAFFLDQRWGLTPAERAVFTACTSAGAIVALALFAKRGENLYRQDPRKLIEVTSWVLIATVVSIAIGALMPVFGLMALFFLIAFSLLPMLAPAFGVAALSIVPPNMRAHAQAMIMIFTTGVGGFAGAILLGSIDRRFGVAGAIVAVAIPGIIGSLVLRSAGRSISADLDRMVDEVIEEEEVSKLASEGVSLPMLACRGIDFSYGKLQILFDVDFQVDDGEMVALLGVNGAGKSTLLRVISGLGLPTAGTVRYRGQDITYLDAERRTRLGIQQIPGGKAVFGELTVVDNLRAHGYTLDRKGRELDAAMELAFETFPRLAERRNQPVSTLSGGEQQMLALTKALMLRPRLLLIDELSLGLAPVIVAQLLDLVREINAQGTAIVLVEQSVNVALSLVDHAYFMEKGQIRFDGPAKDLLDRDDLLRSVFLEGVAGTGSDR